jgi:hypothetical protein
LSCSSGCRGKARRAPARYKTSGNVTSDNATCPDYGVITNGHAWQNDRAAADPHILTDPDGSPKLGTRPAYRRITRMVRCVYLHRRADLSSRSNSHRNDVEDHTVEVEENARSDSDVVTVVAMKWRSDYRAVSGLCQSLPPRESLSASEALSAAL